MTIPDFQTIMRPILSLLADGQTWRTRDVIGSLADQYALTEDERALLLPSGTQRTFDNRVSWALTHMSQAGLVERPKRAHVQIAASGREALSRYPERIDMRVLNEFPTYIEFRARTRKRNESVDLEEVSVVRESIDADNSDVSPQDLVGRAVAENRAAIEGELLKKAIDMDPTAFERLVIALLRGMGYGRLGQVEHSGRSGDGGIDGIISQDPLGLDRIYVQAKRYAVEQTVSRPVLQGFVGALMGAQGDRGVFITTSSFTSGARTEADRVNARIELIDGHRLAELMVDYNVGVESETTATLYKTDEDFFENL